MWRVVAFAATLAVLAWACPSWADVLPEPAEGNRYIQRTVAIDTSALPKRVRVVLFLQCGRIKGESDWTVAQPIPDRNDCHIALKLGDRPIAYSLPLPALQEVETAFDTRTKVLARYRPTIVGERFDPGLRELVFFDGAGAQLCRRPPIDDERDPCDPATPWKRALSYIRTYGWIAAVLVALLAGAWGMRRLRRRRAGRPELPSS